MTTAYINRIGTAVPGHDVHHAFIGWALERLADPRERRLFARMAERAGIDHRWSVLLPTADGGSPVAKGGFYAGTIPPTSARMALYAEHAPALAEAAIRALFPGDGRNPAAATSPSAARATVVPEPDTGLRRGSELREITHLVVASCTGFVAPGIDQLLATRLGLSPSVERTLVGFMGCYAAVAALRTARHIVRSEPHARVLVVTVELSTLHLQDADSPEPLLAQLLFGDGAAAALVTADPVGLSIDAPFSLALPGSADLITWDVGDTGFAMRLSGEVPARIAAALAAPDTRALLTADTLAVHAGGRSILDAVETALALPEDALEPSRAVLRDYGNMSSATLMFVLARLIDRPRSGVAIAFGPGLAAEGFRFARA